MQHQSEILRFKEGARSRHPSPEATVAAAQPGALFSAGSQIAVLVDLTPQLPYRSREIRTLVVKTYWASSGSIVARLRRALAAANRHLVYFNRQAPAGNKCSGNITCAVFADDELFIGQVGAAYTYVYHQSDPDFELFPKRDRLLIPLGGTVPPVIHIGYTTMQPDSVACLATTQIAEAQARETWQETLALSKFSLITQRISRDMGNTGISGSIILVKPQGGPLPNAKGRLSRPLLGKKPAAASKNDTTANLVPSGSAEGSGETKPHVENLAETQELATIKTSSTRGARQDTSASSPQSARPVETADVTESLPSAETENEMPETAPARFSVRLPRPRLSLAPVATWIRRKIQEQKQLRSLRRQRSTIRETTAERARLRQALRTLLPVKIEGQGRVTPRTPPQERTTVLAGISLGTLLLVLFITVATTMQLGGPHKADELLVEARALRDNAFSMQNPNDWYRLLDLSSQIVRLNPESTEALEIQAQARDAIDEIEDSTMLNITPLLDLGTAPSPRRILVASNWIYILNTATDAVVALPLNEDLVTSSVESPTPILKRGQIYNDQEVSHIVDIAWVEPGGTYPDGAVFIYSEDGIIYIYEPTLGPGSITFQKIESDLTTGMVTAMETFGEKFYLIDRQQNQILMYEPVNGIYENPRTYFSTTSAPNLHNAVDVAIDGRVYLLMGDGTLQTYFASSSDHSFEVSGLPDPDFMPRVIAVEPDLEEGRVYLGDTQAARVMVLDKRGVFQRQLRLPKSEIQQIEALAVREDPNIIYLIADNKLYAAPVPRFVQQ